MKIRKTKTEARGRGRWWWPAVAAVLIGIAAQTSTAQEFPAKPVTIITPFGAGSGPDVVARLVGEVLGRKWGQRVVVDNRPGGGGFIAIDAARRAAPDGYTLLQLDSEHLGATPYLYKQRGFKPWDSFEPVAALFRTPFMVTVASNAPWKNVGDMLAAARAEGGKFTYGSWGVGSPGHLGGAHMAGLANVRMEHIPYRDQSQLFIGVGSGDVQWSLGSLPSSRAAYQAGKVRYLAVAGPRRVAQIPDVPTIAEAGGPSALDISSFAVLVVPKGTPEPIATRLHQDIVQALNDANVRTKFEGFAFEPLAWSRQEILSQVQVKARTYQQLIDQNGINLD